MSMLDAIGNPMLLLGFLACVVGPVAFTWLTYVSLKEKGPKCIEEDEDREKNE